MAEHPDVSDLEVTLPGEGKPATPQTVMTRPYRLLLVSDLAGGGNGSLSGPLAEGMVEVNAGSFDELLASAAPTLNWNATLALGTANTSVHLDLRFSSLRAFEPGELARQIPATDRMLTIREQLVARLRGKISADALARVVAQAASEGSDLAWLPQAMQWTPAKPSVAPDVVDSVLNSLDLGEPDAPGAQPPPKTAIGSMVSALAGGGSIPAEEAAAIRRALAELDKRITAWITAVLHSAPVQALETAWRSLAFLVAHIDFRKGTRLFVLHTKKAEVMERFRTRVIDPVFDAGVEAPELIILDLLFGNTAPEIEALDELAQHAASLPAVAIAGAAPGFLGIKYAWQIPSLPPLGGILDQYQFAKWRSLRDQIYARSLGMVLGRGLLRAAHAREDVPELEYAYREECLGEQDFVWASGAVAAASAAAGSLADTGWPVGMAGYVHGRVTGFTTSPGGKKGEKNFGPTDATLPDAKISEMAMVGFNVLAPVPGLQEAMLWNGLTIARPTKADQTSLLEISLPYQLFAARLGVLLYELKAELRGLTAEQVITHVRTNLGDWLGIEGEVAPDRLNVQARHAADDPAAIELAVTAAPPENLLPGAIPVVMGYKIS